MRGKTISAIALMCIWLNTITSIAQGSSSQAPAGENPNHQIRPNISLGIHNGAFTYSYGVRTLLLAGVDKKFGLELSRFHTPETDADFWTLGIILEKRAYKWFNIAIGTIGYIDYGEDADNVFGLVTNIGWEPLNSKMLSPYISFRKDFVFYQELHSLFLLNVGINIRF